MEIKRLAINAEKGCATNFVFHCCKFTIKFIFIIHDPPSRLVAFRSVRMNMRQGGEVVKALPAYSPTPHVYLIPMRISFGNFTMYLFIYNRFIESEMEVNVFLAGDVERGMLERSGMRCRGGRVK